MRISVANQVRLATLQICRATRATRNSRGSTRPRRAVPRQPHTEASAPPPQSEAPPPVLRPSGDEKRSGISDVAAIGVAVVVAAAAVKATLLAPKLLALWTRKDA